MLRWNDRFYDIFILRIESESHKNKKPAFVCHTFPSRISNPNNSFFINFYFFYLCSHFWAVREAKLFVISRFPTLPTITNPNFQYFSVYTKCYGFFLRKNENSWIDFFDEICFKIMDQICTYIFLTYCSFFTFKAKKTEGSFFYELNNNHITSKSAIYPRIVEPPIHTVSSFSLHRTFGFCERLCKPRIGDSCIHKKLIWIIGKIQMKTKIIFKLLKSLEINTNQHIKRFYRFISMWKLIFANENKNFIFA